jgi:hypothetical protein
MREREEEVGRGERKRNMATMKFSNAKIKIS